MSGVDPGQLGRHIAVLRERAGIRQSELARRVTWSQAVVSRVESGERPVSGDELSSLLTAIATPEAAELAERASRQWHVLPVPSLDHPDQDLLWETECLVQHLEEVAANAEIRQAFEQRIREYVRELIRLAGLLQRRDHQIAFIGPIGVGKSTAICKATGMEVRDAADRLVPVLEAGAGGVTLCEVHVRVGPGHGIVVEPRSDEEIRADVTDFVDSLLRGNERLDIDIEGQVVSREVERAIRNMAGLQQRRTKRPDGTTLRRDPARELVSAVPARRELVVEILSRMSLHRRDRRDAWFDPEVDKTEMGWLKQTFEDVNNGRRPDFSLPRRIEIVVPKLLAIPRLTVNIIDTRGIDQPGSRADLEAHLSDPHTVAVLCSGFNDAPSGHIQTLLTRARDTANNLVATNSCLLVLPRPGEALAVKDEMGTQAETTTDGYELKEEQVSTALGPLRLEGLTITFFNSMEDDPENLRSALQGRVTSVRAAFREKLQDVLQGGQALLMNRELEEVQEVQRAAGRLVNTWIGEHGSPAEVTEELQDSLLLQIATTHAATVHASIRREGEWQFLSYTHELGFGARRVAALALGYHVSAFNDFVSTLAASPEYTEAAEPLAQAKRMMTQAYDDLLRKLKVAGETMFVEDLRADRDLWSACESEWGRGPGYRDRVSTYNRQWFGDKKRYELQTGVREVITREWSTALDHIKSIFEAE